MLMLCHNEAGNTDGRNEVGGGVFDGINDGVTRHFSTRFDYPSSA